MPSNGYLISSQIGKSWPAAGLAPQVGSSRGVVLGAGQSEAHLVAGQHPNTTSSGNTTWGGTNFSSGQGGAGRIAFRTGALGVGGPKALGTTKWCFRCGDDKHLGQACTATSLPYLVSVNGILQGPRQDGSPSICIQFNTIGCAGCNFQHFCSLCGSKLHAAQACS